jgi:hypothetical protein
MILHIRMNHDTRGVPLFISASLENGHPFHEAGLVFFSGRIGIFLFDKHLAGPIMRRIRILEKISMDFNSKLILRRYG